MIRILQSFFLGICIIAAAVAVVSLILAGLAAVTGLDGGILAIIIFLSVVVVGIAYVFGELARELFR